MGESTLYTLSRPVFLIGFMGAGKTTVARQLARLFGLAAIDLDRYIERSCDEPIKTLLPRIGEPAFRALEAQAIEDAVKNGPAIVSCGGGIVVNPVSCENISRTGFCVYLHVDPDESARRISDHSTRPLFKDMESARALAVEREPLYRRTADAVEDTMGKRPRTIAFDVADILKKEGILCPQ